VRWPKTERLRQRFADAMASSADDDASLLDLLMDESQPPDTALPDTDVGIELERLLAPVFVRGSEQYGTRASALAYFGDDCGALLRERGFGVGARLEREMALRNDGPVRTWRPGSF
jgi:uncharacterized protein with NRDE domain